MLQSILNDDVQYLQNKKVAKNDIGSKVSIYDVELFNVNVAICLGEIVDTFIDKLIYYCPVYLIITKLNVERIGYFEFYKQELSMISDKDGEINISLLEGPLLFNYVDSDYLINKVSKDQFLKKFMLEEEEFNRITLDKSKTKKKKTAAEKKDGDKDPVGETITPAASAALSSSLQRGETKGESKTKREKIYNEINNIPEIQKIKSNGEKTLNNELFIASKKEYLTDIKSYKGGSDEFWIQGFYNNKHFSIQDVESNGDCFFATLREAFKTMGVTVNVSTLRNLLSRKLTQEDYKFNKTVFNDTKKTLKEYQQKYKKISATIIEKTKEKTILLQKASKEKDDRSKMTLKKKQIDKMTANLLKLQTEKQRIRKAFSLSNEIYKGKLFMKNVKSFEDYLKVINTTEYWADELAISILEVLFNIKVIIISEERFDAGEPNVLTCGTTILKPIEKRGEFNPKYYILINHTGNHYKLIKYKEKAMFTFYELPNIIRENIKKDCPKSLYKLIPLFKLFFEK